MAAAGAKVRPRFKDLYESEIRPKLIEQRYFDGDLLGVVGAGKSRRDDGLDDFDVACLFTSYQHAVNGKRHRHAGKTSR